MKILHITRSTLGGIGRHIADLSQEQAIAGHEVGVVAGPSSMNEEHHAFTHAAAETFKLGRHHLVMSRDVTATDLQDMVQYARLVRRIRPDIVHAHGAKAGVLARLTPGIATRTIYSPHGGSLHQMGHGRASAVYKRLERTAERRTTSLVHASHYEAKAYRELVGQPNCPAQVVPNGIRSDEFQPRKLDPKPADFLFVGELRDLKGIDLLLEAMLNLSKVEGFTPTLAVVGTGTREDLTRYQELSQPIRSRVAFHGYLPTAKALKLGKTLVLPSRAESFPYILLEAAAADVPIVAADVGGVREILTDGAGMFPKGDLAALERTLTLHLQNPATDERAVQDRRRYVEANFLVSRMAQAIENIYVDA